MSTDSDQFATQEEAAAFNEEVIVSDSPNDADEIEETEESNNSDDESSETEKVPAKKTGYVEFSPEQKARVDEITRKRYEAERKAAALEKELTQYKKPPEPPKEVPVPNADPITEPEVFARQQQDREKYIREHTKFEADTEARKQQESAKEQARFGSLIESYNANVKTLGVNPKIVDAGSKYLAAAGITKELTELLLEHDEGPRLVAHFHANIDDAEAFLNMTPVKAAIYIEREIRGKLKAKPVSKAPPPPAKVNGTRTSAQSANGWEIS